MELHRADGNDWTGIEPSARNFWQRIAVRTNGIITPGNIISVVGLILVLWGVSLVVQSKNVWLAVSLMAVGRLADILDGYVADYTKTKNNLGEAVDAIIDKVEIVVAVVAVMIAGLIPLFVVAAIVVRAAFNAVVSFVAKGRNASLHPNRAGKLATAAEWLVIALFVIAGYGNSSGASKTFSSVAWGLFAVFMLLSIQSSYVYLMQMRKSYGKQK